MAVAWYLADNQWEPWLDISERDHQDAEALAAAMVGLEKRHAQYGEWWLPKGDPTVVHAAYDRRAAVCQRRIASHPEVGI